jgi:hypothetical protein
MTSERAKAIRELLILPLAAALWMTLGPCLQAGTTSLYLYVPSITGENATPAYPGAMAVQSLTITPDNFSVVKHIDSASPTIFSDVAIAKPLHTPKYYSTTRPPQALRTLRWPFKMFWPAAM